MSLVSPVVLLRALGIGLAAIALAAGPALGACWGGAGGNPGAAYDNHADYSDGLRSTIDFEGATVGTGNAIVHPMQIIFSSGDFAGWGTARGIGVPGTNCDDDYTGWNTYLDGITFGEPFCEQDSGWPEYSGSDTNIVFKFSRGNCGALINWYRFYTEGNLITCEGFDGNNADYLTVGGEVIGTTSIKKIDIHYGDIERHRNYDDKWVNWSSGTKCEDSGYRIRKISDNDVWAEKVP